MKASGLALSLCATLLPVAVMAAQESHTRWGELNQSGEWAARPIALPALASAHFVPLPRGARNQLVFELAEMR